MEEDQKQKFKFDMQLFGNPGGGSDGDDGKDGGGKDGPDKSGGDDPKNEPGAGGKKDKDGKGLDEAAVQKRIDAALKAAKEKWDKEAEDKRKEDERLSKLSEQERRSEELKKKQKELEAREKELEKKDMELEMAKVLSDRHIPQEFSGYLMAGDSTETLKRVTTFEKAFKKAVDDGVNERLKGKPPKAGGSQGGAKAAVKNGFFEAIFKNQSKR